MIQSHFLGQISYNEAYRLQRELWNKRVKAEVSDQLLLLEHPPVITLGRGFKPEHLLETVECLRSQGVEVQEADRGGDVTYHGPGQLVGYPILDLQPDRMDVLRYLRDLEEVLIRTIGRLGILGERRTGYTGVWVEDRKIAAIGVKISRWVTYHGFALNVNTDLSAFDLIIPCGIRGGRVTSLARELGSAPSLEDVGQIATEEINQVFVEKQRA
jgi:lipoate-protein ligase B